MMEKPIHNWFGLSYSSYLVIPRMALEAMPTEWQENFIKLMNQAYDEHDLETPAYRVLRDDQKYTLVKKYDEEDESSRDYEFTELKSDEWANYRRPDTTLLPEKLRTPKD